MATILPEAARHVRHLEAELLTHFNRFGYDEIILPTFEYLDVLMPGLEPTLLENSYKIVDRTTGRILLLRPDVTAQIARTVAMGMWARTFRCACRTGRLSFGMNRNMPAEIEKFFRWAPS
jgi:ATP phosphoribosyltransferase regulatory subunit